MAMRVSQRMMYSSMISNMNSNLGALMESNLQSSSQKKINRPSDDPYGAAQVLASRNHLDAIAQYKDNLSMAKGWLHEGDNALSLVDTALTDLQGILEQGATGTLSDAQRQNLAFEGRAILDQLITYANTSFNGRYIFAGHKTDAPPYRLDLAVTVEDNTDPATLGAGEVLIGGADFVVQGSPSMPTAIVQPMRDGAAGTVEYRYSTDFGKTWYATGAPAYDAATGKYTLDLGLAGAKVTFPAQDPNGDTYVVRGVPPDESGAAPGSAVTAPDIINVKGGDGTWMYLRPTARYYGDTNDTVCAITYSPAAPSGNVATVQANGYFSNDVAVRLDEVDAGVTPPVLKYSYSSDNGINWTSANVPHTGAAGDPINLPIPGGYVTLDGHPADPGDMGMQFIVKPYRADVDLTIGNDASITINNVGRDVFGGIYEAPFSTGGPQADPADITKNLFELVGEAISFFETNDQQGCGVALANIQKVMEHVVGFRTQIGAKVNRVDAIGEHLAMLKLDEEDRLSSVEDVDVSELLTRLAQQQLAYNSMLKSSSMIMQMSLMNFL